MLSARALLHRRQRPWLPLTIAAGIVLLPITWYLASPLVLTRARPRAQLRAWDKLLWVLARRLYAGWREHLTLVTPETVVRWHRLLSVLTEFVRYYNQDRPHRTLGLQPPGWRPRPTTGSIQSRAFNSWALLFAIAHAETAEAKPGAP